MVLAGDQVEIVATQTEKVDRIQAGNQRIVAVRAIDWIFPARRDDGSRDINGNGRDRGRILSACDDTAVIADTKSEVGLIGGAEAGLGQKDTEIPASSLVATPCSLKPLVPSRSAKSSDAPALVVPNTT
ncbi:hypothetical protein [uncultured Sphingomonas sp.]|uniref:hypothetical protein n=1 Tax=uncultured Sphingomonas sp. TaxID=158754 RepID=UPI0035CB1468